MFTGLVLVLLYKKASGAICCPFTFCFDVETRKYSLYKVIAGVISKGRLTNLTGVSVKVFLFWLNIVEVYVTDDELGFSVGIASAGFPIDNFELCPRCGCGMDCDW